MNRVQMEEIMERIINLVSDTREAGQNEYARDSENVFANFERVASFTKTTLCAYADGHRSQREDVRGRLTDIIVYAMLFWGMVESNEKQNK